MTTGVYPRCHLRYSGKSALVQYHMMAYFIGLYRTEKGAIELDILPAAEEIKE